MPINLYALKVGTTFECYKLNTFKYNIMKNILLFFALSSIILFSSCEGDPGPPGLDGGLVYAKVFETTVSSYQYNASTNTLNSSFIAFPFEVYESDAVLAYRLSEVDNTVNPPADVWTQLPQSVFYNDGTRDFFQYNFNHTFFDVQFTIEGNFPLTNILPSDAQNQIFRIAVVPAEFAKTNPSMEALLEMMQIENSDVEKIE
jgi:hypothetical protein